MKKHFYIIYTLFFVFAACTYISAQNTDDEMQRQDAPAEVVFAGDRAEIPLTIVNKKIVVDVTINGKGPYKFFLDTGAGVTVLDESLAAELKFPVKGTTKIGDPADPQGITANRNFIEKMEMGGAAFRQFIAVSWERSGLYTAGSPRGVIGMPLFRNLLLTIDYPQNKVIVSKGELAAKRAGVFAFEPSEGGTFILPVKVMGAEHRASLDTGSPSGVSFPSSYMDKLPLDGKPVEVGRGRTVGGEAVIYGGKMNGKVTIAGHEIENPRVTFFGRLRNINLGYDALNPFAITIDQKNHRMLFEKPAGATAAAPPVKTSFSNEYEGMYGERRFTFENGSLHLQRVSGPQGEGPKLKLVEMAKDEYALPDTKTVRIRFVRDQAGKVIEVMVLNMRGEWERLKKG